MKKVFSNVLSILLGVIFISCRENVILPEEYTTAINEPIEKNEPNSYIFIINAQNISINVVNNARFSSSTSRISISIDDYSSGYVNVSVIDKDMNSRFNYFGDEDETLFTESLIGYVPGSIAIIAVDFTGKLRITLSR